MLNELSSAPLGSGLPHLGGASKPRHLHPESSIWGPPRLPRTHPVRLPAAPPGHPHDLLRGVRPQWRRDEPGGSGGRLRQIDAVPGILRKSIADILWTLDFQGITKAVEGLPSKRKRLAWLLANHDYLPNEEIAKLAGCTGIAVKKARVRVKVYSCVINREALASERSMAHRGQLTGRSIKLPTWASDRTVTGPDIKAAAA